GLERDHMDDSRRRQSTFNAESRGQWDAFASHRQKVSGLLAAPGDPRRNRLCILGAGNCNELDLPRLLNAQSKPHLGGLDAKALVRGVTRQGVAGHPSLHLIGGFDVTGMLGAIATWSPRAWIHDAAIAALTESPPRRVASALPGPFDLVASTCLLRPL